MDRGTSSYAPLVRKRRRFRRVFKSVELNAVGWSVFAGLCLVAGAVFGGVAALLDQAWWLGVVVGIIAAVVTVFVWDRLMWANLYTSYSWTDDEGEKARVCEALNEAGISAELSSWNNEPPFTVRFRNRDSKRVNRLLAAMGLPGIPGR